MENGTPQPKKVQRFKETGHPVRKHQSSESWNLEKEEGKRNHRAAATWCDQFGLTEDEKERENPRSTNKSILTSVKPHDVQLLVSLPKMASGDSLQENILSFEALSDKINFSKLCEDVWL